ncbi:S-layer homology domain-containing protein [Paenibacillus sp. HB172176]|uniref:S-layer homology domain-containing protein n=1 Tax=Paenibacillus sp. HB172176 TaxID=2493690 RepID=UPI00143A4856|nr:S-layer homology domain-containing protein [Paenibacillus sp. HB172176]
MRKGMSLLLALAVILTGFLPQTADAAEIMPYYSVTSTDGESNIASLLESADGPAIIQNYPMPSIYTQSDVFSLKAEDESIPVIQYLPEYDYAEFSFAGTVSIEVTANEPITSYSISPLAKNIEGTVDGNKLTFTLSTSTYVIVDINEDPNEDPDEKDSAKIRKRLVIAADPLETDIPESSGPGIYNVTETPYNADSTGATITSDAIQQAIDDAHEAGGGTVYIPAGVYTSSNLTLRSNVDFYLAGGAVIVGTGRGEDYRNDFRKDSISDGTYFISTEINSENITLRGRGTIDGKGIEMRKRKMVNPPPTHKDGEGFINNLLVPIATSNFTFDGLILRDGGFWAFLVVRSDNVTITNYKGFQNLHVLEDDAIDINESQNVLVKHAIAISDDDAFSTKTWPQKGMSKDWPGAIENLVNVVFDDCFAWTRCSAFKLGMGICTPQIGVTIRNSYVYQSARALLVDHAYTQNPLPVEGYAQNVTFENIDIERVDINQFGNYWFRVSTSTAGDVSNILFKNINVRDTGGQSPIQGNPVRGGMVNGLTFTDIYVKGKLARSLSDMNAAVKNDNVSGLVIANTTPALFSDDFEAGDTAWWTSVDGEWTVQAEEDNNVLSSWNRTATSLITASAGASWTNYTYEAKVELPFINGDENAGLLFRVQDESNFYMYRINAKSKKLELYKSVAGAMKLVNETRFSSAKQWYTVKVDVRGNTVKGYVDGELKTDWTNPEMELTTGGVGFRTTSAKVLYDDAVVSAINEAPTDIELSHNSVVENTTAGGMVGSFSTADADEQDTFAYALVAGDGDADNGSFSIAVLGNTLFLRTAPDFETKDSYSIRVRSTDSGGLYFEKSFIIHVADKDETPLASDLNNVLYNDDFEDGNTTGWTSNGGNWSVAADDSNALVQKSSTTGLLTAGDAWTDYVYEAQVKVPITNANAGIVFRALDNKNFYMYRVNASNQKLELYKCVGGVMTMVSSTLITAVSNQWYALKVIVQGNTITGYLDGERKVEWTNPEAELTAGKIGFRTTSAGAAFDNVLVTGIKQAQTAQEADASKNTVTLDRSNAAAGDTVTITAAGDRQSVEGIAAGDERFIPVTWTSTETGKDGSFSWNEEEGAYTSSYTASETGAHVVTATFQKQSWIDSAWVNATTDIKSVTLSVYSSANAAGNSLSLNPSNVVAGQTVIITAEGYHQSVEASIIGDERYYPIDWSSTEAGKSGGFTVTEGVYHAAYLPAETGQFKITASYQKQMWDGESWIDTDTTDTQTADLIVSLAPAANADHNSLTLSASSLTAGDTVTITATGDRQEAVGTLPGEERYYPVGWLSTEAGKSGGFTVTDQVYSSSYTTSAAGQYSIEVTFQKQSWDGTAWVDGATDTKSASLTVNAEVDNGGGGNDGGGSNSGGNDGNNDNGEGTPSSPAEDSDDEDTGISSDVTTQEDGVTVTTVSVDPAKLEQKLSQGSKGATIIIPVNTSSDKVVVALNGQIVQSMEAKEALLLIKTEKAAYTLSAAQINMDAVARQMGTGAALQDINVNITIATPAAETLQQMQDTAELKGYQIVAQPVEFSITASSGSNTVEVSKFNGYVERTIAIPGGSHSGKILTGVVLGADGSFSHVPTKLVIIDGKTYAQINSLTNSVYSVVSSPVTFADIDAHWAKEAINDLGSRLVIEGTGEGRFEPDRDITRAEFAAIIIKGLGIMRPGTGQDVFTDVTKGNWYYDAVAIASEYGIIDGYGDGTFGPMDTISREQAMTMTARAMQLTGLKVELAEEEAERLLSEFEDGDKASEYAAHSIAACLKAGIITGRDDHEVAPAANMTRAEVAVIVERLLKQSGLI